MNNRDVEFLFEIGSIRHIPRTWRHFLNADFANSAEHTFRVVWIAMMLAKEEKVDVDMEKIIKMALLHDIPESRTGNVNYVQRQYVERNEDLAIDDIFAETSLREEFVALWKERTEKKTLEAKIVRDADMLDVEFELKEQAEKGNSLIGHWKAARETVRDTQLFTYAAKKMWEKIYESNPHDWHLKGRNRLNAGDWKKE